MKFNHRYMHKGSPLFPIFRALSRSLNRHLCCCPRPPSHHLSNQSSVYSSHTVYRVWYSFIHSMHVLKPSQYSLTHYTCLQLPFYSSSSEHLFILKYIRSWPSHQSSQTLQLYSQDWFMSILVGYCSQDCCCSYMITFCYYIRGCWNSNVTQPYWN